MSRKYKLPDDLKWQCIWLVRGYDRRVVLYHERLNSVLHSSPPPAVDSYKDGEEGKDKKESKSGRKIEEWDYAGTLTPRGNKLYDSTASKALQLEYIDQLPDTKMMQAVEQAKFLIGVDLEESQRQYLVKAIWESCILGRNFKFEYRSLHMDKATFYRRRMKFLWDIAVTMKFID